MFLKNITIPFRVYLELTRKCNNNCLHCFTGEKDHSLEELETKEYFSIINQLEEMNIRNIVFTGGEPLLRKDLFDILDYANSKELNILLLTGGENIDKKIASELKKFNIEIKLSLDGTKEATHDIIRGKGSFNRVLKAIDTLNSTGINNITLHYTVNRLNIKEMLDLPALVSQLKVRKTDISTIKPAGMTLKNNNLLIDPSLVSVVINNYRLITSNPSLNLKTYKDKNWIGFSCPAGHAKFGLSAEGNVTPCVFLGKEFESKNVRDFPLKYLWYNDPKLNQIRNLDINATCKACSDLEKRHGGCRSRALYYSNSIKEIDPYCCEGKKYVERQKIAKSEIERLFT
jgi:radical SAM protein with 4Fe4S-binding SPASM domain